MLKIEFTDEELKVIYSKAHFTPLQKRIIEYRRDDVEITKMALLEHCSESRINKQIRKIRDKMKKAI